MVPPGANPHSWEPRPSQIATLAKAEMYAKVGSGIEFELAWMDKLEAANKKMLIIDCSRGVQLQATGGEERGAADTHIWMSPRNAQIMVRNISDGLVQLDPENKAYYEQNRDAYTKKLDQLDQGIRDNLSGITNRFFMVYHPFLGYFAQEYNLTMLAIEEEGKEPKLAGTARLIEQAKEHNIKVVFAQPQFNPQSAQVIADEIGAQVVFINDLAEDYIDNMHRILDALVQAME